MCKKPSNINVITSKNKMKEMTENYVLVKQTVRPTKKRFLRQFPSEEKEPLQH